MLDCSPVEADFERLGAAFPDWLAGEGLRERFLEGFLVL